jgi:DNA-binding HxlR family transcriptional regulator
VTRTAAQQRAEAKVEYNAFLAGCPSRQLLDRISDKWVTLVLCGLAGDSAGGPAGDPGEPRALRYSELSRLLAGVSQKMLTQTLRGLEADGLVTRTVTPTVPVTVTYELTDLGRSLHRVVRPLRLWAQAHMDEVVAHRAAAETGADDATAPRS